MAKEIGNSLRELQEEEQYSIENGSLTEFCDWLDQDEQIRLQQMRELAEKKRRWLRLFDKMLSEISSRNFEEAYGIFEELSNDLFE